MARDGSGTYSLPSGNPVTTGTTISSTTHNNTMSDIASALTASVAKDGQTTMTANLPMGGFKLTNLAAGSASTDSVRLGQLQGETGVYVSTVGGTADAITLTPSPAITAYAAGQRFSFIASGANTTAVTVAISGLSAQAVTKFGSTALVANNILSGTLVTIQYDGTRFQLLSPSILSDDNTFTGDNTFSGNVNGSAISGYVSSGITYLHEDGANATSFDADANITEATFESIGPTGSSATNIWTAMDDIPAGARIAIISIDAECQRTGTTDAQIAVGAHARMTGSSATGDKTQVAIAGDYGGAASNDAVAKFHTFAFVPLDSSRRFDFQWFTTNSTGTDVVILYLKGFIT